MMRINPLTLKKIKRFRSIKRGYYSLILFAIMLLLAIFAELWINNRALLVYYEESFYFPNIRFDYSWKSLWIGICV